MDAYAEGTASGSLGNSLPRKRGLEGFRWREREGRAVSEQIGSPLRIC